MINDTIYYHLILAGLFHLCSGVKIVINIVLAPIALANFKVILHRFPALCKNIACMCFNSLTQRCRPRFTYRNSLNYVTRSSPPQKQAIDPRLFKAIFMILLKVSTRNALWPNAGSYFSKICLAIYARAIICNDRHAYPAKTASRYRTLLKPFVCTD